MVSTDDLIGIYKLPKPRHWSVTGALRFKEPLEYFFDAYRDGSGNLRCEKCCKIIEQNKRGK